MTYFQTWRIISKATVTIHIHFFFKHEHKFFLLSSKYLGLGFLGCMVDIYRSWSEPSKLCSRVAAPVCVFSSSVWEFSWSACSPALDITVFVFLIKMFPRNVMTSHCGFALHFPNVCSCSIRLHMLGCQPYSFYRSIYFCIILCVFAYTLATIVFEFIVYYIN